MIRVDEQHSATCTHVPRYISRTDLIQLLLETWITDYEKILRAASLLIESSDSKMVDKVDGSIEIRFDHSHLKKEIPWISMIQVPMDDPKLWSKPRESLIDLQYGFSSDAKPIYHFQDPYSGHIYFNVCFCNRCIKRKSSNKKPSCHPTKNQDLELEKKSHILL